MSKLFGIDKRQYGYSDCLIEVRDPKVDARELQRCEKNQSMAGGRAV
jgi:hypothetical protein